MPSKRAHPEQDLHIAVAELMNAILDPVVLFFHCPNGGARSKAEAGILKAMGVKAGVNDLYFSWPIEHSDLPPDYHKTLWIELKAGKGRLSTEQAKFQGQARHIGHHVAIARTIDEIEPILRAHKVPLRGTMMRKVA